MEGAIQDDGESLFVKSRAISVERQILVIRGKFLPGYEIPRGTDLSELFVNFSSKQKMPACQKCREQERKKDNDADEDKNRPRSTARALGGSWNWRRHGDNFR